MRQFQVKVNGVAYQVEVEEILDGKAPQPVAAAPVAQAPVAAAPQQTAKQPIPGGQEVKAPMPGTILGVKVIEGAEVEKGDALMVLEAMKMENEIAAPVSGKVKQILVQKGQSVNAGDVLMVLQ